MTFSRAKPAGYSTGDRLTAAEINSIDVNQSRAIDGYAGGNYNPSAVINFTGAPGVSFYASAIAAGGWMNVIATARIDNYGAINVKSGGTVNVASGGNITVESGGKLVNKNPLIIPAHRFICTNAHWTQSANGHEWLQNNVAGAYGILTGLEFPVGTVITNVGMWIDGQINGSAAHTGLSMTLPHVTIQVWPLTDGGTDIGAPTEPFSLFDTTSVVADYNKLHLVSTDIIGGLAIEANKIYQVNVYGETGTDALADSLGFYGVRLTLGNP